MNFNDLWQFMVDRSRRDEKAIVVVQDRDELEYVFKLIKNCNAQSYLEVGSAEGNSLYVLGNALADKSSITCVDLGEDHTAAPRKESITLLRFAGYTVEEVLGDSTLKETYYKVFSPYTPLVQQSYDVVFIDGGHDYTTVLSDAILYAPLAKKYVFFHDVQLPEVKAAVDWFVKHWNLGKYHEFINSNSYGYGIIEVGKQ